MSYLRSPSIPLKKGEEENSPLLKKEEENSPLLFKGEEESSLSLKKGEKENSPPLKRGAGGNLYPNNHEERPLDTLFEIEHHPVAGVDEVGRGALFGEVVAAAVILPLDKLTELANLGVTDSKKLSAKRREQLDVIIREVAIAYAIGSASVSEIDTMNILSASLLAMERAIAQLQVQPKHCLIDGNQPLRFQLIAPIPQTTVVQGDSRSLAIAAASIVAKVWRDRQMMELAEIYQDYDLATNKGYGTVKHRQAIAKFGYSALHRKSFKLK